MTSLDQGVRLTSFAAGGGCACKIPAQDLERLLAPLQFPDDARVVIGLDHGDDAVVVSTPPIGALVMTTDFFAPVVDDPFEFGAIAAANALSDVYAMGGQPLAALNLLGWPTDVLPLEVAGEVLRGGAAKCREADVVVRGGHSIKDAEPKYGLAVTGTIDPTKVFRIDRAQPGLPLTLTKPLGVGVLNNRHKSTGERFPAAIASMTTLNRDAAVAAARARVVAATDVTGFGLLGHLYKMVRASNVSAILDFDAIETIDGARESIARGFVPGGSRRNLEWVRPFVSSSRSENELLLLADAQTSGGLLVVGEVPGYPIIGTLTPRTETIIAVR